MTKTRKPQGPVVRQSQTELGADSNMATSKMTTSDIERMLEQDAVANAEAATTKMTASDIEKMIGSHQDADMACTSQSNAEDIEHLIAMSDPSLVPDPDTQVDVPKARDESCHPEREFANTLVEPISMHSTGTTSSSDRFASVLLRPTPQEEVARREDARNEALQRQVELNVGGVLVVALMSAVVGGVLVWALS